MFLFSKFDFWAQDASYFTEKSFVSICVLELQQDTTFAYWTLTGLNLIHDTHCYRSNSGKNAQISLDRIL